MAGTFTDWVISLVRPPLSHLFKAPLTTLLHRNYASNTDTLGYSKYLQQTLTTELTRATTNSILCALWSGSEVGSQEVQRQVGPSEWWLSWSICLLEVSCWVSDGSWLSGDAIDGEALVAQKFRFPGSQVTVRPLLILPPVHWPMTSWSIGVSSSSGFSWFQMK